MDFNWQMVRDDFFHDIKSLSGVHGVSGFENDAVKLVRSMVEGYSDEISVDVMKNLIAVKKGTGKAKLMIVAHTDEIGVIIKHIDDQGFLWFEVAGGVRPQQLFGKHIVIKTESGEYVDGVVNYIKPGRVEALDELPKVQDFFIDIGAQSRAEAEEMGVEIGNPGSLDYPVYRLGKNRVAGKALDDRACVFQLIELMKLIHADPDIPDVYAVFSSQEEVGCRGAKTAAYNIFPDVAVSLDICISNDIPDVPERKIITQLDKGPAIKVMDKITSSQVGVLCTQKVYRKMKEVAKQAGIPYQMEVYAAGSTDSATIHLEKGGIASGGILLPARYVHSYEVASVNDVVAGVELLYRYTKALAQGF
jgi:endoglucanase